MPFKKAQRQASKLRLALAGAAGSGKTYSSLLIAQGLLKQGKIGLIDTERGSGDLYAGEFEYDTYLLNPPYSIDRYIEAVNEAVAEQYEILIIDSLSHAWAGDGGILELHDSLTARSASRNKFSAWREVTPIQNKFIDHLLGVPMDLIVTMRSKTVYEIAEDERGKKKPVKIGTAPIQRGDLDHEFTAVLDLELNTHLATSSKDRTSLFDGKSFVPTQEVGKMLRNWLDEGHPRRPANEVYSEIILKLGGKETEKQLKLLWKNYQDTIQTLPQNLREDLRNKFREKSEACAAAEEIMKGQQDAG